MLLENKKIQKLESNKQLTYIKYKFQRMDVIKETTDKFLLKLTLDKDYFNNESYVVAWFDKRFSQIFQYGLFGIIMFPKEFTLSFYKYEFYLKNKVDWKAPAMVHNLYEIKEYILNLEIIE